MCGLVDNLSISFFLFFFLFFLNNKTNKPNNNHVIDQIFTLIRIRGNKSWKGMTQEDSIEDAKETKLRTTLFSSLKII